MHPWRAKPLWFLLLVLFVVPAVGLETAYWLGRYNEAQFQQAVQSQYFLTPEQYEARVTSYVDVCKKSGQLEQGARLCSLADEVSRLRLASVGAAACGALLLVLIFGAKLLAGTNRSRMAIVFGPLIRIVMLVLAVSVIVQAGLFIYLVYAGESASIHEGHFIFILLAGIGLGAIFACFQLIENALSYMKPEPMMLRGTVLDRRTQARLYATVDDIAKTLKAQPPDQIVAGLEPNFLVTVNDVKLLGTNDTCKGRTLFVSLGLMRLLDEAEFKAVVGHELGHFRGQDVEYSMKFAPTYVRLLKGLQAMATRTNAASSLAGLPAYVTLGAVLHEFASAERTVGRERELLADKAGVEASTAQALANALVKISLFNGLWEPTMRANIEELRKGKQYLNLSALYAGHCEHVRQTIDWNEARKHLETSVQPHPVDTHPPLGQRLRALGVPLDTMQGDDIQAASQPSIALLAEATGLEEKLTILEDQFLVATKVVTIPDTTSEAPDAANQLPEGTKAESAPT